MAPCQPERWLPSLGLGCPSPLSIPSTPTHTCPYSLLPSSILSSFSSFWISGPLQVLSRPDPLITVLEIPASVYQPLNWLDLGLGAPTPHPRAQQSSGPELEFPAARRNEAFLQTRFNRRADMPCGGQCRWEPLLHRLPSGSSLWGASARRHHGSLPGHDAAVRRLSLPPSEHHGPPAAPQRALQVCQCLCW